MSPRTDICLRPPKGTYVSLQAARQEIFHA